MSAPVLPVDHPRYDEVYQTLRRVIDPEVGLSIVKMGLLYGLEIAGDAVRVRMTLTTRGCPLGSSLVEGVRTVVAELPWVRDVDVDLVWEPAWSPAMIR